jgi:hypothetical protein
MITMPYNLRVFNCEMFVVIYLFIALMSLSFYGGLGNAGRGDKGRH